MVPAPRWSIPEPGLSSCSASSIAGYTCPDTRLVEVVDGDADACVIAGFPMGYEDLAPLTVIVTEAGGTVTDLRGGPVLDGDGSALVTNGLVHEQFLQLLTEVPTSRDFADLSKRVGPNNPREGSAVTDF